MSTLTVGAGSKFKYHSIASAVAATHDGDVVLVQTGTYTNDFLTIRDSIDLKAFGGMVHINATVAPPDGKAIITEGATGTSVSISGFELTGAQVADQNGAGIRYEGGDLALTACYMHDNQQGILAGAAVAGTGTISIDQSEFAANGSGDGYTHNIYVNDVALLSITNSYVHDAVVGHEIKSRAETTVITNSRIADGGSGTASYSIDLPNGGNATISNDVIEQGPGSQNPAMISYGEEGSLRAGTSVSVSGNTILNDLSGGSASGVLNATQAAVAVTANLVWGLPAAQFVRGVASESGTVTPLVEPAFDTSHPWSAWAHATASGFVPPVPPVAYVGALSYAGSVAADLSIAAPSGLGVSSLLMSQGEGGR